MFSTPQSWPRLGDPYIHEPIFTYNVFDAKPSLTLKRMGAQFDPHVVFPKMYFSERESEFLFYYDF